MQYHGDTEDTTSRYEVHDKFSCICDLDLHLLTRFVVLPKSRKVKMARLATYSASLKNHLADYTKNGHCNSNSSLDGIITLSGLVNTDHMGWLIDQSSNEKRWCIVADMLFCIFKNQQEEKPLKVLVLPGHEIKSLVFNTAKRDKLKENISMGDRCRLPTRTISGLLRHHFMVHNPSSGEEYTFATECQEDRDSWLAMLRVATNLDTDLFSESDSESENDVENCYESSIMSDPKLVKNQIDEVNNNDVKHGLLTRNNSITLPLNRTKYGQVNDRRNVLLNGNNGVDVEPTISKYVPSPNMSEKQLLHDLVKDSENVDHSIGPVFSKIIRHNSCSNMNDFDANKSKVPAKNKKDSKNSNGAIHRIGSIESLVSQVSQSSSNCSSNSNSGFFKKRDKVTSFCCEENSDKMKTITGKSLSLSLPASTFWSEDQRSRSRSDSEVMPKSPKLSLRLVRKASSLREKMFGSKIKTDEENLKFGSLETVQISGNVYIKQTLKWSKIWCVISKGFFLAYKSKAPSQLPDVSLPLKECSVHFVEGDKHRKFCFKLCHLNAKSTHISTMDSYDFNQWMQILKKETVAQDEYSIQRSISDESNTDVDIYRNTPRNVVHLQLRRQLSHNSTKSRTPSCHSIESQKSNTSENSMVNQNALHFPDAAEKLKITKKSIIAENADLVAKEKPKPTRYKEQKWQPPCPAQGLDSCGVASSWTDSYNACNTSLNSHGSSDSPSLGDGETESNFTDSGTDDSEDKSNAPSLTMDLTSKYATSTSRHDISVRQVWKTDRNNQLKMLKSKVAALPNRPDIFNKHLPGPNNEGLMLMNDEEVSIGEELMVKEDEDAEKKEHPLTNDDEEVSYQFVLFLTYSF